MTSRGIIPASRAGWAAAQLRDTAGLTPVADIERDLLRHLPNGEFFFPAVTEEALPSPLHPLSAYVFVDGSLPDPQLLKVQQSRFVETVLRIGRKVARITDKELARALRTPQTSAPLEVGQPVIVLTGDWSGLEGRVAETLDDGRLVVFVELRSTAHVVRVQPHEIQLI